MANVFSLRHVISLHYEIMSFLKVKILTCMSSFDKISLKL